MSTAERLAYQVVDVFTDRAYAGNPLAVVLDAEHLSTEQMQAIARETNLSETTFPTAAPEGATDPSAASPTLPGASLTATYALRIFTPGTELPFAGHPSVGSAAVLRDLGRIQQGENVQACGAGLLPVLVGPDEVTLTGGAPSLGPEVDPGPVLAALGLEAADHTGPPIRFAGTGIDWGFVLVRPEALTRVDPDLRAVEALGGTGVSVVSWDGSEARCRVYAAGAGVPEDPATGSAALGLGVYLAATGLLGDGTHEYLVTQGVEMGRPSTLRCAVDVETGAAVRTTVRGATVPVAEGWIRVP